MLSFVIPIYNAGQYLRQCLESILNQSYKDWEIIAVIDGATDGSAEIVEEYAKKEPRIHIIYKENEGVAIARNRGLDEAKGKFISFVDADDVLLPNTLLQVAETLEKKEVDYLRFEYQTIDEFGHTLYPNYEARARRKFAYKMVDAATTIQNVVRKEFYGCCNVFKRSIIEQHHLRFLPGCTLNEDTLFMVQYFCYSRTHTYLPCCVYGYRKHDGAATASLTEKKYYDMVNVFHHLININATSMELQNAIKTTAEEMGERIAVASKKYGFGNNDVLNEIKTICINTPLTIDWKLFTLFGYHIWKYLELWRKVKRRF